MAKLPALASLDPQVIRRAVDTFPFSGDWQRLKCAKGLAADDRHDAPNWRNKSAEVKNVGGLYAFLFPKRQFPKPFQFILDGPAGHAPLKIRFKVDVAHLKSVRGGYFVAYVGRTRKLRDRLQKHFRTSDDSTLAQVRTALWKCRRMKTAAAIQFMVQHAEIVYLDLDGDKNVANRDIIEVSLWGEYRTPFNVKSER